MTSPNEHVHRVRRLDRLTDLEDLERRFATRAITAPEFALEVRELWSTLDPSLVEEITAGVGHLGDAPAVDIVRRSAGAAQTSPSTSPVSRAPQAMPRRRKPTRARSVAGSSSTPLAAPDR